jgi:hypothetical protein
MEFEKGRIMMMRLLLILVALLTATTAFAEVMTFEKEVEEVVARDQSREQVEAFALQKAKRLAVEEAGTYISSLTVVANAMLQKEEITALASGVVQTKIIGLPAVRLENGVVHVNVKARIQVDTAVLDKQVAELLKEKGPLKRLEDEQRKNRDLEQQLVNLKSTELKRLEELNAQAVAMEQERDRRRLANAEMALKAQGELKKAEIERLQKDRELNARTAKMIADQEKQRKSEADALAREQDRIRRAQLENEQRWNDLARKSQLAQQQWVAIDDSLSLKQALAEARAIMGEIATLKMRSEFQYDESVSTLKAAYQRQIAVTTPQLPPPLAEKDPFESTAAFNDRRAAYDNKVKAAEEENTGKIEDLIDEKALTLAQARQDYLEQQIKVLRPFIERLKALQARLFVLPGEKVTVELSEPDADRNCFPTTITHNFERWTVDWKYNDRDKARDIYKTRAFLKSEAMVQLDDTAPEGYVMTEARITHPGTGERQSLVVAKPRELIEITEFSNANNSKLIAAKLETEKAQKLPLYRNKFKDRTTGMEFVIVEGGSETYFIGKFEVTQGEWQKIMGNNPSSFSSCGSDCPVENVSWYDAQEFISRLNQQSGIHYRLPTESEWLFACTSGGKKQKYCGSDDIDAVAWHTARTPIFYHDGSTHKVGTKQPNDLGIYDMSGNVAEWMQNAEDSERVVRGGGWKTIPMGVLTSYRFSYKPGTRDDNFGFRLLCPIVQ